VDWSRVSTQDTIGRYWRVDLADLLSTEGGAVSGMLRSLAGEAVVTVLESALQGAPGMPPVVRNAVFATAVAIVAKFAVKGNVPHLEPAYA
jgi:hypothetical protein